MDAQDTAWRRQVSELIALVQRSDLTELEIEHGTFALRLERDPETLVSLPVSVTVETAVVEVEPLPSEVRALRSPQVGTFYLSAEPHGEPFIQVGSSVESGQVIGLIEAMKLISEVEAEIGGVVSRILVEDGQPVEYGQALFELE